MKALARLILGSSIFGSFAFAHAAKFPDEVTVTSKYVGSPGAMHLDDVGGTVISYFGATLDGASFSVDPHDFLDLGHAETKEFIAPVLGNCKLSDYSFDFIGPSSELFMISARDLKGQKACVNFTAALENGFRMKFTNVPLLNRGGVLKTVWVTVLAP